MTDTLPARPQASSAATEGARFLAAVQASVAGAVVGAELPLRLLATALLAEGHALVEDVPGVGKTLLARAFAQSLGLTFARVQGTPDLLPTDVTGSSILEGSSFRFIPGPVFANVLLVDEINRATPRTQSALLEAMQERQVSAEGQTRPLPDPFVVLATQNPIELEGTFALPEAQLDRFLLRIAVGYPDEAAERRIASRHQAAAEPLQGVGKVVELDQVTALREAARTVRVADEVEGYLVALVRATREHEDVRMGASPRSSVSLYRAAQAWALLAG
ncbi:MAG TPA: AAA family ATPase, partial [Candidatus Binatia bacterium]|nr:AAA family ATPase [Candidatus Binatia bacterium]